MRKKGAGCVLLKWVLLPGSPVERRMAAPSTLAMLVAAAASSCSDLVTRSSRYRSPARSHPWRRRTSPPPATARPCPGQWSAQKALARGRSVNDVVVLVADEEPVAAPSVCRTKSKSTRQSATAGGGGRPTTTKTVVSPLAQLLLHCAAVCTVYRVHYSASTINKHTQNTCGPRPNHTHTHTHTR